MFKDNALKTCKNKIYFKNAEVNLRVKFADDLKKKIKPNLGIA